MGWIVLTILLAVVWLACWLGIGLVGRSIGEAEHNDRGRFLAQIWIGRIVTTVVIGLIWGLISLLSMVKTVEAGHVGLVYQFGEITGQRGAGASMIWPWQNFKVADARIQRVRSQGTCYGGRFPECMEAFSEETQDVYIVGTLNISVDPADIQTLYRTVGPDYLAKIVRPRLEQLVKEETVKYKSVEIAPHREDIRKAVRQRLTDDLSAFSVNVGDFLIENMDFRDEFKVAIEAKQLASQEALKEFENVARAKNVADQKLEEARGEAGRVRITAEGQATANNLLSASLTPALVQLKLIEALGPDIKVLGLPDSVLQLLNLNSLLDTP